MYRWCTGWMDWMLRRKWRETKQQPSMLPGPAVPGCCLVSFSFLCIIHSVQGFRVKEGLSCVFFRPQWRSKARNLALPSLENPVNELASEMSDEHSARTR